MLVDMQANLPNWIITRSNIAYNQTITKNDRKQKINDDLQKYISELW